VLTKAHTHTECWLKHTQSADRSTLWAELAVDYPYLAVSWPCRETMCTDIRYILKLLFQTLEVGLHIIVMLFIIWYWLVSKASWLWLFFPSWKKWSVLLPCFWMADHPFIAIYLSKTWNFIFLSIIISFIIVIVNLKYYQGKFCAAKKLKGPGTSLYQLI